MSSSRTAAAPTSTRGRWTKPATGTRVSHASPRSWSLRLGLLALMVALGAAWLAPAGANGAPGSIAHDHGAHDHTSAAPEDKADKNEDKCARANLKKLEKSGYCTHGPDPAPPGYNIAESIAPEVFPAGATPAAVGCDGDGISGNRVEVIYARSPDRPDRYSTYLPSFRQWVADADQIFRNSAADTGGSRHVRFVTQTSGSGCVLPVRRVVFASTTGDDNFGNTVIELQNKGYDRTDRKYIVFVDAFALCGEATILVDDHRDGANANNLGPSYGRTDVGCWGDKGHTIAHELMHNLGGVQDTAPNASLGWHCVDEYDVMCYSDTPYYPTMRYDCPDPSLDDYLGHARFDCNHDDYFHTNPPAGSYLAEHWNAAQSRFLVGAVDQPPPPPPANDDFTDAIGADARPYTTTQLAFGATSATDDPTCYDEWGNTFRPRQTVWYKTTPTTSGTLSVDTFGSRYDTVLAVYTGSRGNLRQRGCNDDAGSSQSKVNVATTAGTTYYIMVSSYVMVDAGTLTLNLVNADATPALGLSKDRSKFNGVVEASLTGFAPNSPVTLKWPRPFPLDTSATPVTTDLLASGTTDATGAATLTFRTPLEPLGNYPITGRDAAGGSATAVLRVIPRIMFNETSGPPDLRWRVYFYGFAPSDRIEVRWHTGSTTASTYAVVKTLTVAENGRASSIVAIPSGQAAGVHLVVGKVIEMGRSASAPFTLTTPSAAAPSATATATATSTPVPTLVATEIPVPTATAVPTEVSTATAVPTEVPTATAAPNASPVASAGEDTTVADADGSADEPVVLDGTGSTDPEGSALAYAWSVAGAEVATGPTPTVVLPVGTTTVTLTVTDGRGATATDEVLVVVEATAAAEEPVAEETTG